MKHYITEKQFEQLKKLIETFEELPRTAANDENEMIEAEGGDPIESLGGIIEAAIMNPLRELKFLAEDIEGQEVA